MARTFSLFLVVGFFCGCVSLSEYVMQGENFVCPPDANGFYPEDVGCTPTYYYCMAGTAYEGTCPCDGNSPPEECPVFEPTYQTCVNPEHCTPLSTTTLSTTTLSTTTLSTTPTTTSTQSTNTVQITTLRPFECPYDGFFPIPESCSSSYYICFNGATYPQSCPEGSVFDPVTYSCTYTEEASCVKPFECPPQTDVGFYPYSPESCSSLYYVCVNAVGMVQYCPGNTVFHPESLICVPSYEEPPCKPGGIYTPSTTQPTTQSTTTTTTTTTTTLPSTLPPFDCLSNGLFPVPESCTNTFYFCIDGVAVPEQCPESTIFDPVTYKCTPSAEASCKQPYECPIQTGTQVYPYSPEACSSLYYTCINGVSYVRYCPGNAIFLPDSLICTPVGEGPPCKPGESYTTLSPSKMVSGL